MGGWGNAQRDPKIENQRKGKRKAIIVSPIQTAIYVMYDSR